MTPDLELTDRPARVLVVDDDHLIRQLLEIMLTADGYSVQTTPSGEGALALVAEHAPDLILLDVKMPGMDGYQLAGRLKADFSTKNIPIIMVTGMSDRDAKMRSLNAGAEDFVTKPVDHAELRLRVRNLLRLRAYGAYLGKYSQELEAEVAVRTTDLVSRTLALERQALTLAAQAALLDLTPGAVIVGSMDSRILFWSRGAETLYGWSRAEALGQVSHDVLKSVLPAPIDEILATLVRHGHWEGEPVHHTRDGTRLVVESRWVLQRDEDGVPLSILTINNDISARKEADAERRLQSERLSLATAVARVGVWEWDLGTGTLAWDATMFDIYGLQPVGSIPYHTWSAAVHHEDLPAVEAVLQKAIADKGKSAAEFRITRPDGEVRNISAVERVVLGERGEVIRVIGVNMDVTARKQVEESRARSVESQIRFKDEFLSHVSHELRSPLTAIKQFTSILLGGSAGELNKEQREYEQIVLKNIHQLQAMIDDLIEVTRLETGKLTIEPESAPVAEALADTLHTLQGAASLKGVTVSIDAPLPVPSVYADKTRLRQILIILLDNAIKFTPGGGTVTMSARLLPRDPRHLLFEVADTGCGIGPELSRKIFDRLYQASDRIQSSRKGLGLGLYICKELVTRQDGEIWATGALGQGSTFSFTLPIFSLEASLPVPNRGLADSVALVMVEISLQGTWPSDDSREEWSREARGIVQRCLLPELEVLVPAMSSGVEGERFLFVVRAPAERSQLVAASMDEQGVSVLGDRIRTQFDQHPTLNRAGLTVSVSYSLLQQLPSAARAPASDPAHQAPLIEQTPIHHCDGGA